MWRFIALYRFKIDVLWVLKKGFRTACRIAGIEGLIWKDLRATFGTRLEAGCDAFTIAQLLGYSDVRHVLVTWSKQPATALAVIR